MMNSSISIGTILVTASITSAAQIITISDAERGLGISSFLTSSGEPLSESETNTDFMLWNETISIGPNEPGAASATDYGIGTQSSDIGINSGFYNTSLESQGGLFGPLVTSNYRVNFSANLDATFDIQFSGSLRGEINRGVRLIEDGVRIYNNQDDSTYSTEVTFADSFSYQIKQGSNYSLLAWSWVESEDGPQADPALASMQLTYNVPEPSSTMLLGLGGLALILRRKK